MKQAILKVIDKLDGVNEGLVIFGFAVALLWAFQLVQWGLELKRAFF